MVITNEQRGDPFASRLSRYFSQELRYWVNLQSRFDMEYGGRRFGTTSYSRSPSLKNVRIEGGFIMKGYISRNAYLIRPDSDSSAPP